MSKDLYSYAAIADKTMSLINSTAASGYTYMYDCTDNSDCSSGQRCCWGYYYSYDSDFSYTYLGYQESCDYDSGCKANGDYVGLAIWAVWMLYVCGIFCFVSVLICCIRGRRRRYIVTQTVQNPQPQVTVVSTNTTTQPQYQAPQYYQPQPGYAPQQPGYAPMQPGQYAPQQPQYAPQQPGQYAAVPQQDPNMQYQYNAQPQAP